MKTPFRDLGRPQKIKAIKKLKKKGLGSTQISIRLGISNQNLEYWLKKIKKMGG